MVVNGFVELLAVGVVPLYIRIITEPMLLNEYLNKLSFFKGVYSFDVLEIIYWGLILLLFVYVVKLILSVLNGYLQERFIRGRESRISTDLLKRYLLTHYQFHLQRNSAELIRNAQIEIQQMNIGFVVPLLKAISQLFIAPLIFLSLLMVNAFVSSVTILTLAVAIVLYNLTIKKSMLKYRDALQYLRIKQIQVINEALGGIKELKVLRREHYFLELYKKLMNQKRVATIKSQLATRLNAPFLEFIALIGILIIVLMLTFSETPMAVFVSTLAFYGVAMFRLKQSATVLLDAYTLIKVNHITIRPVYSDMVSVPIQDIKPGKQLTFNNNIQFVNVSYFYPGTNNNIVEEINMVIHKGESVGIVGPTGAGKTTLVDLLLGLLEPQQGSIIVDGQNIFKDLAGWQSLIGYIPQHIYLLDDTIRANVAFGLPKEMIDDKFVWKVLETAQLSDFVRELPKGLDTITGERGIRLSGGQRQRIGIARALYQRPSILVMDEATSALDNKTEKLFITALEQLRKDHTLIIIAHRLSTIMHCDRILVMERGRIKAEGTYAQLIETEKVFQELAQ